MPNTVLYLLVEERISLRPSISLSLSLSLSLSFDQLGDCKLSGSWEKEKEKYTHAFNF